jgi:hypothetical protein
MYEQHPSWLQRLGQLVARLAARLHARRQARRDRAGDGPDHTQTEASPDPRPAFLREQVRAEERFHVAEADERQLGALTPPPGQPTANGSGGQPPQPRQQAPRGRLPGRRP